MVTSVDPVMRRLVDVDPAAKGYELPPVSDVARFEAILERGRTEQRQSRPVRQLRSWRPGLVVAAAAFAAVLVVAGALGLLGGLFAEQEGPVVTEPPVITTTPPVVTTTSPVATTAPPPATTVAPVPSTTLPAAAQYEVILSDLDDGTFSASGSAVDAGVMCSDGTLEKFTISKDESTEPSRPGTQYSAIEEYTLTCANGSGTIAVGVWITGAQLESGYLVAGSWFVARGTGDYEHVNGSGDLNGDCDTDGADCSYEYTGRIDLTRELGAAPTAVPPAGRHDVTIVVDGSFIEGPFAATGAAVDTGLFCPDGMMLGDSNSPDVGPLRWEHTFFCPDERGWTTIGIDASSSILQVPELRYGGRWEVIGSSSAHGSVTGNGTFSGVSVDDGHHFTWTYTGYLEIPE
jgi:hypothetical protein